MKGFVIPDGYSLSAESGIEKIVGKDVFQICRRVIVIKGIAYSVEDKAYKLILRYLNNKWHSLQPVGEGTIFNTRNFQYTQNCCPRRNNSKMGNFSKSSDENSADDLPNYTAINKIVPSTKFSFSLNPFAIKAGFSFS